MPRSKSPKRKSAKAKKSPAKKYRHEKDVYPYVKLAELKAKARDMGLQGYSKLNKIELGQMILRHYKNPRCENYSLKYLRAAAADMRIESWSTMTRAELCSVVPLR